MLKIFVIVMFPALLLVNSFLDCRSALSDENPVTENELQGKEVVEISKVNTEGDIYQDQDVKKLLTNLTDEEKSWYQKFNEGVLMFDGWTEIADEILEAFPDEIVDEKAAMVERIGVKIGTEWCRSNHVRKINNTMLIDWGDKIKEAAERGYPDLEKTLHEIENEVDVILDDHDDVSYIEPQS